MSGDEVSHLPAQCSNMIYTMFLVTAHQPVRQTASQFKGARREFSTSFSRGVHCVAFGALAFRNPISGVRKRNPSP